MKVGIVVFCPPATGTPFSGVQTLLTLAIMETTSGRRGWCRQHKTRHAEAACRRACTGSPPGVLAHPREGRVASPCLVSSRFTRVRPISTPRTSSMCMEYDRHLVKEGQRMTTAASAQGPSPGPFTVVGTRPLRHDGLDKVTGHARYGADVHLPGLLHGKVLRSPHAHARIRAIDTRHAEALPGVKAVATARDFPIIADRVIDLAEVQGNARLMAENILAHAKALYTGHAVAAVAATSPHIAEDALQRIVVDYEVLPAVLTLHDAMKQDAPLLHETMTTRFRVERFERGQNTREPSNIAGHLQFTRGDLAQGFAEADVIVAREFSTQTVHQGARAVQRQRGISRCTDRSASGCADRCLFSTT